MNLLCAWADAAAPRAGWPGRSLRQRFEDGLRRPPRPRLGNPSPYVRPCRIRGSKPDSVHGRSTPNDFSNLTAMLGDSEELPFSKFDRAGLPTPNLFAASVTDIPAGITCSLMKVLGCTGFSNSSGTRLTSKLFYIGIV